MWFTVLLFSIAVVFRSLDLYFYLKKDSLAEDDFYYLDEDDFYYLD